MALLDEKTLIETTFNGAKSCQRVSTVPMMPRMASGTRTENVEALRAVLVQTTSRHQEPGASLFVARVAFRYDREDNLGGVGVVWPRCSSSQ